MRRPLLLAFLVVSPIFAQGTRTGIWEALLPIRLAQAGTVAKNPNSELENWKLEIQARLQRAWVKPASARLGLNCIVYLTQSPGGEVLNVRLGQCNGDAAVRGSIQAAAFRGSPLPPPANPAVFATSLDVTFNPADGSGAHFVSAESVRARRQAQEHVQQAATAAPPGPEFMQDAAESKARHWQTKEEDLYAVIFHYLALSPTIPVVFAIVGPLPADQCAGALATLEKVAGLPPGYRSASRCGDRQRADELASTYQCRVIDKQSVDVRELPSAIQYVYSCQGVPFAN